MGWRQGAAIVVATGALGGGISVINTPEQSEVLQAQNHLARYEGAVESAEEQLDNIRSHSALGKGCIRLIDAYLPDGPLSNTLGANVIREVMMHPEQPCGTDPHKIEKQKEQYFGTIKQLQVSQKGAQEQQNILKNYAGEAKQPAVRRHLPETAIGVIASLLGLYVYYIRKDTPYDYDD